MSSKVILITGASRGIGYEIARQCGALGHHVILTGRCGDRLKEAATVLRNSGVMQVHCLVMDVSDHRSVEAAACNFAHQFGKLDVIVNNAGVLWDGNMSVVDIEPHILEQTVKTNALGALYVVQKFRRFLNRGGRIVNISSVAGRICGGIKTWAPVYSMSKTLLNAITLQLAVALAPNVTVNAMCPGRVRTQMGGEGAMRSIEQGAETAVWLALNEDVDLTGHFFQDKKVISW